MIMRILLLRRMHHPPLCRRPTTFLPSTKRVPVVSVIVPWITVIVLHLIPIYDMKIIPHHRQQDQHPRQRVIVMIIITRMNNNPTRNRMIVVIIVVPAVVAPAVVNISIVRMIPIYPKGTSPILLLLLLLRLRRVNHHHHHIHNHNHNRMTI